MRITKRWLVFLGLILLPYIYYMITFRNIGLLIKIIFVGSFPLLLLILINIVLFKSIHKMKNKKYQILNITAFIICYITYFWYVWWIADLITAGFI